MPAHPADPADPAHRTIAAGVHQVPLPFRAFAVRSDEAQHASDARAPYGLVHVVQTDFLDAGSLAGLAAEGRSRVQIEAFSDIDYATTTLAALASAAPRVADLVGSIADALQLTGAASRPVSITSHAAARVFTTTSAGIGRAACSGSWRWPSPMSSS